LPIPRSIDAQWQASFVRAIHDSGLAGRGGASFPSAIKLAAARADGRTGLIVVNGMEGEPASDKDKVLLSRAPHLVLDGAQLLAAACGADRIVVCIPIGRDAVAAYVARAIAERNAAKTTALTIDIVRPPDRFIAGEESALVQWIESGNSLPTFRPDKSVRLRIGKRSALIHNAETLAHVALIARRGPQAFRRHGMAEDPGTSLVTISGAVTHPGVVEIDRGTPLRDIAELSDPAGPVQAMLVGGYGGSWVGPHHFETPYASIPLRTIGASAGVGIIVVLGAPACGLAETARLARYAASQSSGQCGPCVYGLADLAEDMEKLASGSADTQIMIRLHRRLESIQGRGACRHPDGAVGLVRSALDVFASDLVKHVSGRPCPHHLRPTQLRFPTSVEA